MIKTRKILNGPVSVRGASFEFCRFRFSFVSNLDIRISDFVSPISRRDDFTHGNVAKQKVGI